MTTLKSLLKRFGKILYILFRPAHTLKRIEKLRRQIDGNHETESKLRADNNDLRSEIKNVVETVRETVKIAGYRMKLTSAKVAGNGKKNICRMDSVDDMPAIEIKAQTKMAAIRAALTELNAHKSIQIDRVEIPDRVIDPDDGVSE